MKRIEIQGRKPHDKPSNKSAHLIHQPFAIHFNMNLNSLPIMKNLLAGTESKEWLTLAEDQVYKQIKANAK
jgi:hypothetical protein